MKKTLVALLAASALVYSANAAAAEITWTGCGVTMKAFMQELTAAYERKTGTKVVLKSSGATQGIRAVAAGEFDVGASCRHKVDAPEEKDAKLHQVAWDAIVFIVHRDNPVDNVSTDKVKDILTGKIRNWKEVGGPDAPIKLYVRKGLGGVDLMLREMLFNDPNKEFAGEIEEKKSSGPVEAGVAEDVHGMGASGISSTRKRQELKILTLDGVAASKENIISGSYPLYRPLYLVSKGEPTGDVKKLIEFALGPEGQAIISAQGTVNMAEGKALKPR
jgi:phosphate transport system substrate-binding protein